MGCVFRTGVLCLEKCQIGFVVDCLVEYQFRVCCCVVLSGISLCSAFSVSYGILVEGL